VPTISRFKDILNNPMNHDESLKNQRLLSFLRLSCIVEANS